MKPKFTKTKRNGNIALFVEVDGCKQNIWDLTRKELSDDVFKAIISAFHIGCNMQKREISKVSIDVSINDTFVSDDFQL